MSELVAASPHYNFSPGRVLARKYEVISRVGAGDTGELYMLNEQATGIERTARFFDPDIDPDGRIAALCAKKLHKLRHCDILVQYRTQETISVDGRDVTFLVSDFVRGELLPAFLARQVGGRLKTFEALHLLHAIAHGLEKVHLAHEYHGELKLENLMVQRKGLGFQVKLLELHPAAGLRQDLIMNDVYDMIRIFYEAIGGSRFYSRQPAPVKAICLGLRRPLIAARFRDAGELRRHLETMPWT